MPAGKKRPITSRIVPFTTSGPTVTLGKSLFMKVGRFRSARERMNEPTKGPRKTPLPPRRDATRGRKSRLRLKTISVLMNPR